MRGSSAITAWLASPAAPARLHVFVVWEPILPTDWTSPTTAVLARIPDRRAAQYWDRKHVVSVLLTQNLPDGEPECCSSGGHFWDVAAIFTPGERLGSDAPIWISGPVVDSMAGLRQRLTSSARR